MRMIPTTLMSTPLTVASTAKYKIAPIAASTIPAPMPMSDAASAAAKHGVPAGPDQEGGNDQHDAQDDLALKELDHTSDGENNSDDPKDECHD